MERNQGISGHEYSIFIRACMSTHMAVHGTISIEGAAELSFHKNQINRRRASERAKQKT